ncbi:hypothetical protein HG536_0E03620 [Torulaspora globosa]|uniref:ATP-dependent DNA helicase RRM3 n=1 Tax=Torulaspora globosa TaxID=48254 RepID=A0A7G3ZIW5_9SACH|nr:uncharacterized protein HG536_0E03620 [Torulaspora globosa]QLL33451.1 hypothetical protein HG536_0E03620 [Torulaspora globosa]
MLGGGNDGTRGKPVLRQKTLNSFFIAAKKTEARVPPSAVATNASLPPKVTKSDSLCSISRKSALFDSQGSFDESDLDSELKKLINPPKLNNLKKGPVLKRAPLQKSESFLGTSQGEWDVGSQMTSSLSSSTSSFSSEDGGTGSLKRSLPPRPLQGLKLNASKRIRPLTRKLSNVGKAEATISLTEEQQTVLDLVLKRRASVFYTGCAGTGKSIILRTLIAKLHGLYGKEAIAITASTGLAAATIGGTTLHKWSGVGIGTGTGDQLVKRLEKQHNQLAVWRNTRVLIIDEVSMIDGHLLDKLELVARRLRKNEKPFGGIQLVLTGDFFQLPPVQKRDSQQGEMAVFCFESEMWKTCIHRTILLTKVFRQQDDELVCMLNAIRFGEVTPQLTQTIRYLSRAVSYPDGIAPTELYATRREVESSNARQLASLPGEAYRFHAVDAAPKEYVTLLDSSLMVEKIVTLKVDAQVMMLKNKPESELFNGSLGKVLFFITERLERVMKEFYRLVDDDVILDMRIVSRAIGNPLIMESLDFKQDLNSRPMSRLPALETMINHAKKTSSKEPVYPYVRWSLDNNNRFHHELMLPERFPVDLPGAKTGLERNQLPLMLCWALSIHKAQGQTIQRLRVDLRNIFEAGQVYVALSRAVSKDTLQVLNFNPKRIRANEKVKEFYRNLEVLS